MVKNSTVEESSHEFTSIDLARQLFGEHNNNLQKIAEATDVRINARGNTVFIHGEKIAAALAGNILKQLYGLTNLKTLDLTGTEVTANGIAELKEKLPDCDVKN